MGKIEELAALYEDHVRIPWQRTMAGAQRVIMVVYEKELERTLRARIAEFEQATRRSGHGWKQVDCTRWFAQWLADESYRDAYLEDPSLLRMKLEGEFKPAIARRLAAELDDVDDQAVVALVGVASLYGFARVSELIRSVEQSISGRLVVFFPGTKDGSNYRLLDARDGWNYMACCITLHGRGGS